MIQTFINGFLQGLIFAVIGVAFSLVYSTTRVLYLALGATFTSAPYVLLGALQAGLPWFLGLFLTVLIAASLGLLAERFIHWPLELNRSPGEIHLIASLGMFLVVNQIAVLIWGNDPHTFRSGVDSVYSLSGFRITQGQAIGAAIAVSLLIGTFAWLRWSNLGLQFRAMASNAPLLASLGRDVRKLRYVVFASSGVLAALPALAIARDVGFDPNVGMGAVLVGVAATIVGGRGSLAGAAIAGLILGVLRAQVVWYSSARWEDAATFVLLALFLLFVPGGLSSLTGPRSRIEDVR